MTLPNPRRLCFCIDRGGTFTDIVAFDMKTTKHITRKLLSVDPGKYSDAPREGIRRILQEISGHESGDIDPNAVPTDLIRWIRMGTTIATNALLERQGERVVLLVTKGFADLLEIGHQARPNIFDLEIKKPSLLYERVIEVDERLVLCKGKGKDKDNVYASVIKGEKRKGCTAADEVIIEREPDVEALRRQLQSAYDAGIHTAAVCLLHSYIYPDHERVVARIAEEIGFSHISLSSELLPMIKVVPRAHTVSVDAYLTPLIRQYVSSFVSKFKQKEEEGPNPSSLPLPLLFMRSDGGLSHVQDFTGFKSILSGPAGGVVALSQMMECVGQPLIGFDMGGTSTDVSRYGGHLEHVMTTEIAGASIQAPQLDITTVAAGGGSRLYYRSGMYVVGPESAGAHPGPICYRKKGGFLSVTDANLMLGRISVQDFPSIFGENQNEPLDLDATKAAFEQLAKEVNAYSKRALSLSDDLCPEDVAQGFVDVANEAMARPIRSITEGRGYNTAEHALAVFGGAGPQHCCAVAKSLGIGRVIVHKYASCLSAYGLSSAKVVYDKQEPFHAVLNDETLLEAEARLEKLGRLSAEALVESEYGYENVDGKSNREEEKERDALISQVVVEKYLNLRYDGTDTALMTQKEEEEEKHSSFLSSFLTKYRQEFGFSLKDRPVLIDDVRVRAYLPSTILPDVELESRESASDMQSKLQISRMDRMYIDGEWRSVPVYWLADMLAGDSVDGPCRISSELSTIVIDVGCTGRVRKDGSVEILILGGQVKTIGTGLNSIHLSVFAHRFMSIAEQMGRALKSTATSTNIKERLDFSCAVFGPNGDLIANAPHLPVHLGSMGEAVKWQINKLGDTWMPGETLMTNHPAAGGSHLPDITVITPVFLSSDQHEHELVGDSAENRNRERPIFYVASRGHHADIGGTPGSMPPFSTSLSDEGVAVKSFVLVRNGVFQEEECEKIFSISRNIEDNLSDLKAQVAANHRGGVLLSQLVDEYTLDVVWAYMDHVQSQAELAVKDMLKGMIKYTDDGHAKAVDYLDDGTPIALDLNISLDNEGDVSAVFDFTGTGPEVLTNLNTPRAVTYSAVLYCLRAMVKSDIPLNAGCLKPIKVIVPDSCVLNPSADAAVVGGNVLTSQRVTDVILSAFNACANSQGCMNNFTFGNDNFGYYETIAGGAGAGPTWNGASAVQTHMTNTQITDPEVFERRYDVLLREFSIRHGSGGSGKHTGGDGVIRDVQFLAPLSVSILSERRSRAPRGMNGGGDGSMGLNLWYQSRSIDGKEDSTQTDRIVSIGGKSTINVNVGDRVLIHTPGGGGWGGEE